MDSLTWLGSWGWQVAGQTLVCLALGAWVGARLERAPSRAHTVIVLALGAALLTPLVSVAVNALGYGAFVAPAPAAVYRVPGDDQRALLSSVAEKWLLAGWVTGAVCLFGGLCAGYTSGRRLVARSERVTDPQLLVALSAARHALRLRARPQLRSSPEVPGPMIWIWGRDPVVIIPDDAAVLGAIDWEAVFVHELAHLRRRDHWTRLFADVVAACLFWNPAVWWVRAQMGRISEFACDDWVVRAGKSPAEFACALLSLRRSALVPKSGTPALALIGRRNTLKERVLRLLRSPVAPPHCGWLWTTGAVALAAGVALGLAVAQASPQPTAADTLAAPIVPASD